MRLYVLRRRDQAWWSGAVHPTLKDAQEMMKHWHGDDPAWVVTVAEAYPIGEEPALPSPAP